MTCNVWACAPRSWGAPIAEAEEELEWCLANIQLTTSTLTDTLLGRTPPDLRQGAEAMLVEGRFLDVAKRLQNPEGSAMGGDQANVAPFIASELELTQVQASPRGVAPSSVARVLERTTDGRSATSPSAATFRSLARTKATRTLLAGLGIVAVGYLVVEAKFVGTASELVAIFFWGFTADVSVDALVGVVAKEKR